jgi:predicted ATPase
VLEEALSGTITSGQEGNDAELHESSLGAQDSGADAVQQIHIAGFCSLKDVVLEPGRFTLPIDPNGAGKSNLLEVLRLIPLLRTGSLRGDEADHGFGAALLHYGPKQLMLLRSGF